MPAVVIPRQDNMNTPLVGHIVGVVDPGFPGARASDFQIWNADDYAQQGIEITGSEFSQILEVQVRPNERVTAMPGTMLYTTSGIQLDADLGGVAQSLLRCCCAGESMFRLHFKNYSQQIERIALTPTFPAKIVPIRMPQNDGMVFNRGAFLGALGKDWSLDLKLVGGMGTMCCGGQGLFLNTLHGNDMVFLQAGGTVVCRTLLPGEKIVVDKHSVLAFDKTVTLEIKGSGGVCVCCCAGQGLFNAVLKGPGRVMLQTMSLGKLRAGLSVPGSH